MPGRPQRLAAEFIGTYGVVIFSAGAVCADQFLRNDNQPGLGPLGIALAYGFAFGTMLTAVGYAVGVQVCGLNPAITIAFWGTRRLGTLDAITCCLAQLAGAASAAYTLRSVLPEEIWRAAALGTPALASGITRMPGMLLEGFASFFLVFTVFATTLDGVGETGRERGTTRWLTSLSGGLVVTAGALFTFPFTGGSMNPARAFGPAFAGHYWTNHGIYWIGPLSGGVLAAWIYEAVFLGRRSARVAGDADLDD